MAVIRLRRVAGGAVIGAPGRAVGVSAGQHGVSERSPIREVAEVQIVVTELGIEDAVGRARGQVRQADEGLSQALAGSVQGPRWLALGTLAIAAGTFARMDEQGLP